MFENMQKLPIKYFDTNSHGDIMSYYTNDTDTLRQMIYKVFPNAFLICIIVISVFSIMFITVCGYIVTVLTGVVCMFYVTKHIGDD